MKTTKRCCVSPVNKLNEIKTKPNRLAWQLQSHYGGDLFFIFNTEFYSRLLLLLSDEWCYRFRSGDNRLCAHFRTSPATRVNHFVPALHLFNNERRKILRFRVDLVSRLSYLVARPSLEPKCSFFLFAWPTDPPSQETGRWETKHVIGMA